MAPALPFVLAFKLSGCGQGVVLMWMLQDHWRRAIGFTGLLGLCLIGSSCGSCWADGLNADDGWRRTASGWERRKDWALIDKGSVLYLASAGGPIAASIRWDTHPAVLALVQIVVVVVGYATFPAQRRVGNATENSWRDAVAQSFQASVFGSAG
jgi:hypothetical protein